MIKRYPEAVIGHSDHTPDIYSSFAAVTLGAKIIEKHVILDKKQPGPDQSVSIDFEDLRKMVDGIRKIELALGETKKVHKKEKQIRDWAFRSVVSIKDIPKGNIITQSDVWSKGGTGIASHKMEDVIGRKSLVDIPKNKLISWEDLSEN